MQVNEQVLARTVKLLRERKILVPTFAQMRDPATVPQKIKDRLKQVGLWDVDPVESVSHHVEERAEGTRRAVRQRQLDRVSVGAHRHRGADRRPGRQVVSDRGAQGRRRVWLPGAEAGVGAVRSDDAESGLAVDGQFLPRRGVRLRAVGLPGGRHSARGDEPRAVRVAQGDRGRGDRDARLRVEREGNLRQVLGDSPHAARLRDLQPVRGVRQLGVALPHDRQDDRRDLSADRAAPAIGWPASSRRPARPARFRPAIFCGRCIRT